MMKKDCKEGNMYFILAQMKMITDKVHTSSR